MIGQMKNDKIPKTSDRVESGSVVWPPGAP
jgi:hypothetical protein